MVRRQYYKKFKGVDMKTGFFYTFTYRAWQNDPKPTIILMYALAGINEKTGTEHRYFQAINFTYIPRSVRRRFIDDWVRIKTTVPDTKFTYELVKRRYPYLIVAIRRYFYKPSTYINKLYEIPLEEVEKYVISTWHKDFSKKVKVELLNKFRRVLKRRRDKKSAKRADGKKKRSIIDKLRGKR